jgi:hypothetical protein
MRLPFCQVNVPVLIFLFFAFVTIAMAQIAAAVGGDSLGRDRDSARPHGFATLSRTRT